jgi:hypothetical protein
VAIFLNKNQLQTLHSLTLLNLIDLKITNFELFLLLESRFKFNEQIFFAKAGTKFQALKLKKI